MDPSKNMQFFCSWSGGKDACLALQRARNNGAVPRCLLTTLKEDGRRTRGHGLDRAIIEAQAKSLGLPVVFRSTSWEGYEEVFVDVLRGFKEEGLVGGVFGDIDLEPHREWVERVCAQAGLESLLPLWQRPRRELLFDFFALGYKAVIIAVSQGVLDESFLGRELDRQTVADLEAAGVDACGEEGEYHTVVTDGPLFARPLALTPGEIVRRDGYSFLDMQLAVQASCPAAENSRSERRMNNA